MKQVITGDKLKEEMLQAINLICDATTSTLGPTGNNILINNSEQSPFITNDGVTIANNIESDNQVTNTILEIVKEASLKTNELVGDGTTTTLVLLQSIYSQGYLLLNKNEKGIILKEQLNDTLKNILLELEKYKKKPTRQDLLSIATISANDEEIGKITSNIFFKMKNKYSIKLKESEQTYYEIRKGYNIEINKISSLIFKNKKEIGLDNTYIVVLKGYLTDIEQIAPIINESFANNKNLLIFAEDYEKLIEEELLVYYLKDKKNIFIIPLPEYGIRREEIEEDISIISECNIKNVEHEQVTTKDLGVVENIQITKEEVILSTKNPKINKLIRKLKKEVRNTKSEYEKEFIMERLSKLTSGIATIYIGGQTKTETKEKIMRYEDALSSLEVAKEGVVVGEGLTLLNISSKIKETTSADKILKKALEEPFNKIITNLGLDKEKIKKEIINSKYKKIYNYKTKEFEDIEKTKILDSSDVVKESLKNAVSIAGLLLTTEYIVINETINVNNEIKL